MAYLDNNGVLYLWGKVKSYVSTAISGFYTKPSGGIPDSDIASAATWNAKGTYSKPNGGIPASDIAEGVIPAASATTPKMDGTAAVGSETAFARGDHVHPSDTTKVDKVSGKGLSTNDYTTTEKNKLSGVASGAQVNVIETVKVNGTAQSVTGKAVDITVPTALSDLTNDGHFVSDANYVHTDSNFTAAEKSKLAAFGSASTYALKSDLTNAYIYKGSVATVSALPSSGVEAGWVYNVEASGMNYAWNGTEWDALGETFTITSITNAEIDAICT